MLKLEHVVLPSSEQLEFVIEGMRNPKNSWDKSDSVDGFYVSIDPLVEPFEECCSRIDNPTEEDLNDPYTKWIDEFEVGPNDLKLMTTLAQAGTEHRKYMRMMPVYVRITAPLYWWKEFDTYKVGTVANSCSTMHKIAAKEFTYSDFSNEHLVSGWPGKDKQGIDIILPGPAENLDYTIRVLNSVREEYLIALKTKSETGLSAKDIWWQMIQLLPSSYNQTRNVMLNYEVLANIYHQRRNHKLDEWHVFCDWIETLPYADDLIIMEKPVR